MNEKVKKILLSIYGNLPPHLRHLTGCYNQVHKFYQEAQWWPKEKIEAWQLERLKMVVSYAYENTAGYRQLYDEAGAKPSDITMLSDVKNFPTVDKALLRDNIKDFTVSGNVCPISPCMTGGSTGIPFKFYADRKNAAAEYAFMETAWESIGWKPKDIGVKLRGTFLGSEEDLIVKDSYHHYTISSCFLTEENYKKYISLIKGTNATYLHVYPSTLTDLSHLIISHHDEGCLNIKHIFLGSENLYSWQKELIRQAFPSAKLMSWYGHTERVLWASYCEEEEKYHLCPFYGYAELLDGEREVNEGEVGEMVGTSFWMFGTPFIRYRTNDFAEKGASKCDKCGRNFQLLNYVDGRLSEIIIGKTGRRISLTVFAGSIMHGKMFEHISQFRFIQDLPGILKLAIVPNQEFSEDDRMHLDTSLKTFLGDDFEYSVETVESLNKSKNGKFSYLEQHLQVDRADNLKF